jgi:site-specific DNA-methyltransferase (adenine-specific)
LAVAVEDAGFEIRDNIAWIYGSGFPKSLDVSKAIDKAAGEKRERYRFSETSTRVNTYAMDSWTLANVGTRLVDDPITDDAHTWKGWGTALKPAHEPIVVGRKPLGGRTVAENVLLWGVGGLNIDGSRIGTDEMLRKAGPAGIPSGTGNYVGNEKPRPFLIEQSAQGRWPANVIFDEVSAGLLDEQSGVSKSSSGKKQTPTKGSYSIGDYSGTENVVGFDDNGGASRFFYVAKASKRDRNEGLEELNTIEAKRTMSGGADTRGRPVPMNNNFHPTVKPTALMRYLIKLVTPPGGTVLDPFTGSGSTGKAALLDGFSFVGVELTAEYLPIIEGRLRWAIEQEGEEDVTLF